MIRKATGYAGAGLALIALVNLQRLPAQSGNASAESFEKTVLPVLQKNCLSCHNQKLNTAGLNLEDFKQGSDAVKNPAVWTKVAAKLKAGQMPPRGLPAPSTAEVLAVTRWIEQLTGQTAEPVPAGFPGRVTARRLNRAEYNNTIRDLLGVHARPADEFPVDDSGYGFDNNGDVLTLSPLLMEKYISAARRVSRLAVYGETLPPKPTVIAVFMPKKGPDDAPGMSIGVTLPYSIRGALSTTYLFPVEATYELRVRIRNHRDANGIKYDAPKEEFLESFDIGMKRPPTAQEGAAPQGGGGTGKARPARGPRKPPTPEELKVRNAKNRLAFPPLRLLITVDGKQVGEDFIEGNTEYMYDRGDVIARFHVTAGEHSIRASFPELADLDDPRRNINPDGRRRIYVEQAELAGPYDPATGPSESHRKIFACEEQTTACARKIVTNLGSRAYRRPMTPQEIEQVTGLVNLARRQGDSFQEGVRVAVQAMLISPNFLFRIETDPKTPDASRAHQINNYELASRLSYFLWSSMPDRELFRLAKDGTLAQPAVLDAQVKRMMRDPKSAALVDDFAGQWLGIRNLDHRPPDADRFQTTDDELLAFMHAETNLFVSAMFREDHSTLDFLDARFTYLNGPLANHYGIPGVKGEDFRRVELTGDERGGILTQGSIMIVSAYPTRTSVVTRGKWVLENFLGAAPPPPPPNVPTLAEGEIGTSASLRQKMEQHRANPTCAVCHVQMDPIGFGLENYDAAGAWRTHDGKFPIDASGTLPGGESFNGALGLEKILRSRADQFARHFTEELMTYALGRGLEEFDRETVNGIVADAAVHDYRFSSLVSDIIHSKPFRMRGIETAAKLTSSEGAR